MYGGYVLIRHDPNMYRLNSDIEANKWTADDKIKLSKEFTDNISSQVKKKHPEEVKYYCNCVVDKIMKIMGRQDYIDDSKLPQTEQDKIFTPIVDSCAAAYHRNADSVERQKK